MSETSMGFSDAEIEDALVDLSKRLSHPPIPDLASGVSAHLHAQVTGEKSARPHLIRRTLLYPVLAAIVILASALALSPAARSAVASWLHISGVQIQSSGPPPGPLGRNLDLGKRVPAAEAQKRVSFHILIPHLPDLDTPDEVYVGTNPPNGNISLVYHARPGLPRAATTGAGLLITESKARFFIGKHIPPDTIMQPADVSGDQAVWLSGALHIVYYIDAQGRARPESIRLAGSVLLWQHGAVTFRIEGRITFQRALQIAQSMERG